MKDEEDILIYNFSNWRYDIGFKASLQQILNLVLEMKKQKDIKNKVVTK